MAAAGECCLSCRYSRREFAGDADEGGDIGSLQCRRHAPRPVYRGLEDAAAEGGRSDGSTLWSWPVVFGEQWCGEWLGFE
jgi:hypothetical protein